MPLLVKPAAMSGSVQGMAVPRPVCVLQSRYSEQYVCTVKQVRVSGPEKLEIDFLALGDGSLGPLQPPSESSLRWSHCTRKPRKLKVFMEIDETEGDTMEGTMFFDGVPTTGTVTFVYGRDGYGEVVLHLDGASLQPTEEAEVSVNERIERLRQVNIGALDEEAVLQHVMELSQAEADLEKIRAGCGHPYPSGQGCAMGVGTACAV